MPHLSSVADLSSLPVDQQARALRAAEQALGLVPSPNDRFPVPDRPPVEWFEPLPPSDIPVDRALFISPEGRVVGRFYENDGSCLLSDAGGECWRPPADDAGDWTYFHQSAAQVTMGDGSEGEIRAGLIVVGHASDGQAVSAEQLQRTYNRPDAAAVMVRAYADEIGGVVVGSVRPGATNADVELARQAAMSGHWIEVYDNVSEARPFPHRAVVCLGPQLIVRAGLPARTTTRTPLQLVASYTDTGRLYISPDMEGYSGSSSTITEDQSMTEPDPAPEPAPQTDPPEATQVDPQPEAQEVEAGAPVDPQVSAIQSMASGFETFFRSTTESFTTVANQLDKLTDRLQKFEGELYELLPDPQVPDLDDSTDPGPTEEATPPE